MDAYHSKINNRKEGKKQRIKIPKENYMKYKENSKENQLFYYKKEETLTHRQHGRFMQKFEN